MPSPLSANAEESLLSATCSLLGSFCVGATTLDDNVDESEIRGEIKLVGIYVSACLIAHIECTSEEIEDNETNNFVPHQRVGTAALERG